MVQNKFSRFSQEGTGDDISEELANLHYEGQCTCIKDGRNQVWALLPPPDINILEFISPLQQSWPCYWVKFKIFVDIAIIFRLHEWNNKIREDPNLTWPPFWPSLSVLVWQLLSLGFLNPLLPGITNCMIWKYFVMPRNKQIQVLKPVKVLSQYRI